MNRLDATTETANQPLPAELFARIKAIQVRTQRLVTDVMAGQYESTFKGRGMEFEEVREYRPGDDIRHIDWAVTARMNKPYVKEYKEERELTVMILVDVSSSGAFGSVNKLKNEVAAEAAAVLAYTAIKSNDKVGLIIFSDRIELYIPPKKGRAHVWRVIREILFFRPENRSTDLAGALDFLGRVVRKKAVVFLISDFLAPEFGQSFKIAAKRFELTSVTVTDPREVELPPIGLIELEDPETGDFVLVDTYDENLRKRFKYLADKDGRQKEDLFRSSEAGKIPVWTNRPTVDPIIRFFRSGQRRYR
ncbi:MAG: DUF58 domain-containing protein [Deltaproteobacteria bacterium]|nr:DUF58 domain-containing protein [Deltaproteobacteria bacterium]